MGEEGIWEKSLGNEERRKLEFAVILNQGNKKKGKGGNCPTTTV